jgi:hypothetical protein
MSCPLEEIPICIVQALIALQLLVTRLPTRTHIATYPFLQKHRYLGYES